MAGFQGGIDDNQFVDSGNEKTVHLLVPEHCEGIPSNDAFPPISDEPDTRTVNDDTHYGGMVYQQRKRN